jgi:hypothetical protein
MPQFLCAENASHFLHCFLNGPFMLRHFGSDPENRVCMAVLDVHTDAVKNIWLRFSGGKISFAPPGLTLFTVQREDTGARTLAWRAKGLAVLSLYGKKTKCRQTSGTC